MNINLRGLFSAKALLVEEQQWYYLSLCWGNKKVQYFSKGISPKVNIITRLEFERAYYDVLIQHVSHYTTDSLPSEQSQL